MVKQTSANTQIPPPGQKVGNVLASDLINAKTGAVAESNGSAQLTETGLKIVQVWNIARQRNTLLIVGVVMLAIIILLIVLYGGARSKLRRNNIV